jgi:hypothetical protein
MTFLACENMSVKNGKDLWFSWGSNESLGRVLFFFQAAEEAKKREKELAEAEKSAGKMGDISEFLTVLYCI